MYIVENGLSMFLWLGHNLNPEFVEEVFGVSSLAQINIETCVLLELDNPRSQSINRIISKVRSQRSHYMKVTALISVGLSLPPPSHSCDYNNFEQSII